MVALEIKEKRLDLQRDNNGLTYSSTLEVKNKHSSEVAIKVSIIPLNNIDINIK